MTKHRSHSAAFKRRVAEEFIAGETLHALSKRHDISRQLIRIWVGKFEAGAGEQGGSCKIVCKLEPTALSTGRVKAKLLRLPPRVTAQDVEIDGADIGHAEFTEADKTARDKALRAVETQVMESLEENLGSEDASEWNWQALANQVNLRWGLKTSDRQLKQVGNAVPPLLGYAVAAAAKKLLRAM